MMDAQQRREGRLSRRRERERRNRALESAEEREARLARRRVRDRALRAVQSTAQREEALQAEGRDLRVKRQRRGRFVDESVNGEIVLWKVQKMQLPSTSHKALPQTLDAAVICRAAYAQP